MRTGLSIKGGKYLLTPISCISLIEVACFKSKSSDDSGTGEGGQKGKTPKAGLHLKLAAWAWS